MRNWHLPDGLDRDYRIRWPELEVYYGMPPGALNGASPHEIATRKMHMEADMSRRRLLDNGWKQQPGLRYWECNLGSFKEQKKGRGIEMEITEKKTYTITLGDKELGTIKTALNVAKRQVEEEADGMDKNSEPWRRCKELYTAYLELLHTMQ